MPAKKRKAKKKSTKKKTHKVKTKDNVVKIQVETTAPKRKKSTRKKKSVKKKSPRRTVSKEQVQVELNPIFTENFVAIQKVMVNLSQKYENLNVKISKLLELFETSARTLAKKDFKLGNEETIEGQKEILDKVKTLEDQNKIIAKGMTMLHEQQQGMMAPATPAPIQPAPPQAAPPIGQPMREPSANQPNPQQPGMPPAQQGTPEEQYKKSASFKPLK